MAKLSLEGRFAQLMGKLFNQQKARILKQVSAEYVTMDEIFWIEEEKIMQREIQPFLIEVIQEGAQTAMTDFFFGRKANPDLIGTILGEAVTLAKEYGFQLITQITATTRATVEKALIEFITTEGFTIGDFTGLIEQQFGPARAAMIAVTEHTRLVTKAGELFANELRQEGIAFEEVWNTNADAATCEICGPLNRTVRGIEWTGGPPAHPRCRCWITRRLKE